jgi:transposase-like protein
MGKIKWRRNTNIGRPKLNSPGCPNIARSEYRQKYWNGIAKGLTADEAAIDAGVSTPVGRRWFRHNGGMAPQLKPILSGRYLTFDEREEIALLVVKGCGVREIARQLSRSSSTVSRELRRNAATRGGKLEYRASVAQWHSDRQAKRPKISKLAANYRLRQYVQKRLAGKVNTAKGKRLAGPYDGSASAARLHPNFAAGLRRNQLMSVPPQRLGFAHIGLV